jgi:hypothetical protein
VSRSRRLTAPDADTFVGEETFMSALSSPIVAESWFRRAWNVLTDLLIATAVIWALPLMLGAAAALIRLLLRQTS